MAGIDIDWEPLRPKDLRPVNALLVALRKADPHALLTMPLTPTGLNDGASSPFLATIARHLNQLNLMTYGMEGYPSWGGWNSWHSSALHGASANTPSDVETAVSNVEATGVPAAKIGVGVGFFGQCWSGVTGPGQDITHAQIVVPEMPYRDIATNYYNATLYNNDTTAAASYLGSTTAFGPKGCTYLSYEDNYSIDAKGEWAQAQGLGGAIVWAIPDGHFSGATHPDALLGTVMTAFGA